MGRHIVFDTSSSNQPLLLRLCSHLHDHGSHQITINESSIISLPPAIEILNLTLIVDISSSILNVSLQFNCLLFSSSLKIVGPEQKKTQLFASHVFMAICVFNMHTPCRRGKKTLVHIPWRQDITFFLFL